MALKSSKLVQVSGTDVSEYAAHADFVTDYIEWDSSNGFSLNAWFNTIVGSVASSTITIEASNSTDAASFNTYKTYSLKALPIALEDTLVLPKYLRISYAFGVAGSGTLIEFNLVEISN